MRLDLWLTAPLAHALGRALAHFLWQGALLAAVLRAALFLGAERSSRWRHQAATACLLALPLAFGITLALSLGAGHESVVLPPAMPRVIFNPVIAQSAPAAPVDWLAWIAPLWMGGVILFYAFRLAGWVRVDRMRRRGVCVATPEWQQRLRELAAAVRVSQPVELLESCLAGVPLVIGYWRPVILMPLGALAGLSAEQVEAILIHELAHIRRADYLVGLAQSLVEGLFFFHPAVWWISAALRAEREYACDDVVVALRPDARAYAAALTTLEQNRWPAIQAAAAANGGDLVRRVRRLLGDPAPARVLSARASALAGALVLVAAVAAALVVWPPAKSFAQEPAPAESAADKQETARGFEQARKNIDELKELLADKQKEIQEAEQTVENAHELLQRNAAELNRKLQNADFAQAEEQPRREQAALKELDEAPARKSRELLQKQEQALQQAEKQLQEFTTGKLGEALRREQQQIAQAGLALKQWQTANGDRQERTLLQVEKQLQELTNGKLDEAFRQQQGQLARADQALQQARTANGDKSLAEIEKQLLQAEKEFDRVSRYWGQGNESLRAQAEPRETPQPQALAESGSAYQKWLNEDVAYIITAEERRDYLSLRTDADRDQFIERFWLRRDPTPETAENEFKEEHYRRLAYANEHFASSITGWRTDRGRIYIVYGPPDEITDHTAESLPRQVWLYHHIEGLGVGLEVEFTDPGRTGDFRMVAAPASHGSYWQVEGIDMRADVAARMLQAKGFPALAVPLNGGPGPTRVVVGPYPDEASFAKAKASLEAAGYHPTKP
jgi:GWxTD domain-containing protein